MQSESEKQPDNLWRPSCLKRGKKLTTTKCRQVGSIHLPAGGVGVAGGIEPGDEVIVRGAERLSAGQAVEIIEAVGAR